MQPLWAKESSFKNTYKNLTDPNILNGSVAAFKSKSLKNGSFIFGSPWQNKKLEIFCSLTVTQLTYLNYLIVCESNGVLVLLENDMKKGQ